jgi:hypothetical protein
MGKTDKEKMADARFLACEADYVLQAGDRFRRNTFFSKTAEDWKIISGNEGFKFLGRQIKSFGLGSPFIFEKLNPELRKQQDDEEKYKHQVY